MFFVLLPTQLGKHFWPNLSIVSGIRIDYLSPTLYVTDVLLILLFASFLFRYFRSVKDTNGIRNAIAKSGKKNIFLILILVVFISSNVLFATRPLLTVYGYIKLSEFILLTFYIAKTIKSRSQFISLSVLFTIGLLFESVLAILQYINQGSLNGIFYFFGERSFTGVTPGIANASINGALVLRPYATFPHPNVLAAYLLVGLVLVWNYIVKNKGMYMQVLGGVTLFIGSIALLLTFGRVVILLWAFLVVFVLINSFRGKFTSARTKIFVSFFLCVCVLGMFLLPVTREVINRLDQTSLSDESVTERVELLTASWKMIQMHPFTGVGLDNFIPSLAPIQKPMPLGLYLQPVHNIFVLILAETGIIGFVLFLWIFVRTIIRVNNQPIEIRAILFLLISIIVITGMFDHYWLTLQQGQLLFAVIIGFCWSTQSNKKSTTSP